MVLQIRFDSLFRLGYPAKLNMPVKENLLNSVVGHFVFMAQVAISAHLSLVMASMLLPPELSKGSSHEVDFPHLIGSSMG